MYVVLTFGMGMAILGVSMAPVYDTSGIIVWLIFTLLPSFISKVTLPIGRVPRLTIRDTLAYE